MNRPWFPDEPYIAKRVAELSGRMGASLVVKWRGRTGRVCIVHRMGLERLSPRLPRRALLRWVEMFEASPAQVTMAVAEVEDDVITYYQNPWHSPAFWGFLVMAAFIIAGWIMLSLSDGMR